MGRTRERLAYDDSNARRYCPTSRTWGIGACSPGIANGVPSRSHLVPGIEGIDRPVEASPIDVLEAELTQIVLVHRPRRSPEEHPRHGAAIAEATVAPAAVDALDLPNLDLMATSMQPLHDPLHVKVHGYGPRILETPRLNPTAPAEHEGLEDTTGALTNPPTRVLELSTDQRVQPEGRDLTLRPDAEDDVLNATLRLGTRMRHSSVPPSCHNCYNPEDKMRSP